MMQYDNDAKQMKYEVLKLVAKYTFEGTLNEHLEDIPYDIIRAPNPTTVAAFTESGKLSVSDFLLRREKICLVRRIAV